MLLCKHCGRPLNESQYRDNKHYKSCPKCSINNGKEHTYYSYSSAFGITPLRASSTHEEGPQSYCQNCRGNGDGPYPGYKKCSAL